MDELHPVQIEDPTIELIAQRVITLIRDDLDAIAAELAMPTGTAAQLTVNQVAQHLGVARSTVYAHWREWGGYKLGPGDKAPIRFDSTALPIVRSRTAPRPTLANECPPMPARRRRRREDLLIDAPRLTEALHRIA